MKAKLLFFIMLCVWACHYPVAGQDADSMLEVLKSQQGEEHTNTLILLAETLSETDPVAARSYAQQAATEAGENQDQELLAHAFQSLGSLALKRQESDTARYYYHHAVKSARAARDLTTLAECLTGLAYVYSGQHQPDTALIMLQQALVLAEQLQREDLVANIEATQGAIYGNTAVYDKAIEQYHKALQYYRGAGHAQNMAITLNNMGALLLDAGEYENAIPWLTEALTINDSLGSIQGAIQNRSNLAACYNRLGQYDPARNFILLNLREAHLNGMEWEMAGDYNNLANILVRMNSMEDALKYYDSSLMISEKLNIPFGIMLNHQNMGSVLARMGQARQALGYLRTALRLMGDDTMSHSAVNLFEGLAFSYSLLNQYDSAWYYDQIRDRIKDSLHTMNLHTQLVTLEKNHDLERSQADIELLQHQIRESRMRQQILVILGLAMIILLSLVWWIRRSRKKQRRLQTELLLQEKLRLEEKVQYQQKELAVKAMHMARQQEMSAGMIQGLQELRNEAAPRSEKTIRELIIKLNQAAPDEAWKEFETRYEQVHEDFYHTLIEQFPDLSPTEIKVCSLLRLNLTTKDIAILTNRSVRTVESTRNRIRGKLNLNPSDSLTQYLLSL